MAYEYYYSVIIPHKNIPELLERCLASIPERDDVQIIIVDDNSDPSVVDFEKFPGIGRKNTEVIFTKEEDGRKGAGYARNIGMAAARGKWLVFADADDFFLPAVGDMMDKYRDDEDYIVYFYHNSANSDNPKKTLNPQHRNEVREMIRRGREERIRYWNMVPWAKFIKRQLVEEHSLHFEEVTHANDTYFCVTAGYFASHITANPTAIYCYIRRDSSLTGAKNKSWESELLRFNVMVKAKRFTNQHERNHFGIGDILTASILYRRNRLRKIDRNKAKELEPVVRETISGKEMYRYRLTRIFHPPYSFAKNRVLKVSSVLKRR